VYKSNGTGWQAPVFYSLRLWAGLQHEAITLGDFDSDGDFDILGGGNANGTLDFLTNTGSGTFIEGFEMYGGNPITEMQNVDLNGDLKPDLVMTHLYSGGGTGAHVDYFLNTSPQNWLQLPPATMSTVTGHAISGNLASVATSDNEYLVYRPGITFSSGQAPVQVVMEAVSPSQTPIRMKLAIEGHTQFAGISRTLEAFDFVKGNWVAVVSSNLARGDDLLWLDTDQAARFVEQGTRIVRVRVSFRPTRPIFTFPWNVRIDRVAWAVR
jgi:hypothetical protein